MIVAFTKDWDDVPTCTTHILREMAKNMPVLWVSSIGTRKPSAVAGKDLRRIAGRVIGGLKPAEWKENKLKVLKPILIPKAESRLAKWINRKVFGWYVRRERGRESGVGGRGTALEYWCFVPNAVDLISGSDTQAGAKIIYYCADDWTQFHNLDGDWMAAKERDLVKRADVVFVTSRFLQNKLAHLVASIPDSESPTSVLPASVSASPSKLCYMPHGVEYDRFVLALDKTLPIPADIADLPKPVVGFYGNLHSWVDFELIKALALARQQWSFVLIGEKYADVAELESLPNVFLAGRRDHAQLHNFCRGFDVAIIPYDMTNPRMESVNPVKTKELLSAGLPVVAADVPELRNYGDDVITCTGINEWLNALDRQILREDHSDISTKMRGESWVNKVSEIRKIINSI